MNKSKENNTDTTFKKAVALESTIALLNQKAYKNPECPVEAHVVLEIYKCYLTNEKLTRKVITRFGEITLYHTKEFEIHKNNHDINVFILKAHYVKKTSPDRLIVQWTFLKMQERWLHQSERQLAVCI